MLFKQNFTCSKVFNAIFVTTFESILCTVYYVAVSGLAKVPLS